jgi:CubicO group peptidase (beta-lactamase class C family)
MTGIEIHGHCDPRHSAVKDAFARGFAEDGELGAAVSLVEDGETMVDLWAGTADPETGAAWDRDSIVCMMSVAKAVSALAVHMLVDRGVLDLDAPVTRYWPEFGQHGKGKVPVRWTLSHLASVPVADAAPRGSIYDWQVMTDAIAAQEPLWPPGTQPCYHTATMGFMLGELVRRTDGRTLGGFIREEISRPLGIDYQIGLTDAEIARCARMIPSAGNVLAVAQTGTDSLLARGWGQLPADEDFNSDGWRRAEIPSANGHGNARAVARLYGALARGGEIDGIRLISAGTLDRAIEEQWHGPSAMSGLTFRMGLGFFLNCPPDRPMGPNPRTFGHSGAGGAQSFADPDARIGFAYSPNRMHSGFDIGPRAARLIEAAFAGR